MLQYHDGANKLRIIHKAFNIMTWRALERANEKIIKLIIPIKSQRKELVIVTRE